MTLIENKGPTSIFPFLHFSKNKGLTSRAGDGPPMDYGSEASFGSGESARRRLISESSTISAATPPGAISP